jgi:hypothetical protein
LEKLVTIFQGSLQTIVRRLSERMTERMTENPFRLS